MDTTETPATVKALPHESYRDRKPVTIAVDERTEAEKAEAFAQAERDLAARFA